MSETLDLTNRALSPEKLAESKKLAKKLKAAAPKDVMVQKLTRSLELGYITAAKDFYKSQADKFRQTPTKAKKMLEEELMLLNEK